MGIDGGCRVNDRADDEVHRRSYQARAGITALNLIAPGLGLIRVGDWRTGALALLAPFALLALTEFGMGRLPITSYGRAAFALVVVLGFMAALYVVPAVLTWRRSGFRYAPRGWSRWCGLTAIAIVMLTLAQLATPLTHRFYKPFYVPSESMVPILGKGDKFVADMRWRGPIERGEIVIFNGPDSVRVSRIAAISGDRIAMRGGMPVFNGKAAIQSAQGQAACTGHDGLRSAAMLTERLPGEASTHRVLDTGPSEFDNTQEVVVPVGHFFVLGDNRDRSADSRVPAELSGVGMVPLTAIIGRPMYIHWSTDRARVGTRLDR